MGDALRTTDDELNFVLGNDVGQSLEIDTVLANQDEEDLLALDPPGTAMPFAAAVVAAAAPPTILGDDENAGLAENERSSVQDARRNAAPAPACALGENVPAAAGLDGALENTQRFATEIARQVSDGDPLPGTDPAFSDPPVLEDLPMDSGPFGEFEPIDVATADDFLPGGSGMLADLPLLDNFGDFNFDFINADAVLDDCKPLGDYDKLVDASSESNSDKAAATDSKILEAELNLQEALSLLPPTPHSYEAGSSKSRSKISKRTSKGASRMRPPRKRKAKVPDIVDSQAGQQQKISGSDHRNTLCRIARGNRRRLRAKSQAINLVGGGDVSEIERQAVADSTNFEPSLLTDFFIHFDAKKFLNVTFDQVYKATVETVKATEAESACDKPVHCPGLLPATSHDSIIFPQATKSAGGHVKGIQTPTPASNAKATAASIVTPPALKTFEDLKSLPSGKDPESRRLRKILRNRVSAQASRDKRKRAIEDALRAKASKEAEIRALHKTLRSETQRMMMLEEAVAYAKRYLGPKKFSRVASAGRAAGRAPGRAANAIKSDEVPQRKF